MRILNSFSVGSWRTEWAPVFALMMSIVPSRPSGESGLGGEREPEVEVVVAQVVVGDARVGVDELRGAVRVLRVDLGGDQHRGVAERARVEDRRDLADDAAVEQALDALHDLVLGDAREPRDVGERARAQLEGALHQVEQLLVGLVEGDRAAVLARAHLRLGYWSHLATSLAW